MQVPSGEAEVVPIGVRTMTFELRRIHGFAVSAALVLWAMTIYLLSLLLS